MLKWFFDISTGFRFWKISVGVFCPFLKLSLIKLTLTNVHQKLALKRVAHCTESSTHARSSSFSLSMVHLNLKVGMCLRQMILSCGDNTMADFVKLCPKIISTLKTVQRVPTFWDLKENSRKWDCREFPTNAKISVLRPKTVVVGSAELKTS
jgi:hypothetical protein